MSSHIPAPGNAMNQAMAQAKNAQQARQEAASAAPAPAPTPEQPISGDGTWSFGAPNVTAEFNLKENSALFELFQAGLTKLNNPNLLLLEIDNNIETEWFMSSITLAFKTPAGTALMPIMLESTSQSDDPSVAKMQVPGTNLTVEVARTLDGTYDSEYRARIIAEAVKQLGLQVDNGKVVGLTTAPAVLLSRSFDVANANTVSSFLRRCAIALRDMLAEQRTNFSDVNVAKLKAAAQLVIAAQPLNRGTNIDATGYPTRIDFTVQTSEQSVNQNQAQSAADALRLNRGGNSVGEARWSNFGALMDFTILPPPASTYGAQPQQPPYKRFALETVITAPEMYSSATTAAFLFSLSLMPAMVGPRHLIPLLYDRNRNYASAFGAGFNPGDVGMLNLIANWRAVQGQPPVPVDTQSTTFSESDFRQYMTDIIAAYALSIDLPRAGAYSAVTSILASIATGNDKERAAGLGQLTVSLNRMSDGKFSDAFFGPANKGNVLTLDNVFSSVGNSIYMGHFPVKVGDTTQDVDLRMIDTLAVISRFGQTNPDMITKWHQSNDVKNVHPYVRMALKREVIAAYTGDTYTITQVADRAVFNIRFIEALAACNVNNGLNLNVVFKDSLAGASTGFNAPAYMNNASGYWTDGASAYSTGNQSTGVTYGGFHNPNTGRY